uniref:Copine domain-containing protein n=1 Tax=Globodera pallida TaxID=36090 RepID=A0A183BHI9_GLOPA
MVDGIGGQKVQKLSMFINIAMGNLPALTDTLLQLAAVPLRPVGVRAGGDHLRKCGQSAGRTARGGTG